MKKKDGESLKIARMINMILGFLILVLVLYIVSKGSGTQVYEVLLFALAAIENFIAATLSFSEQKKRRGNIYAVICGLFLIAAVFLAVRYFVL